MSRRAARGGEGPSHDAAESRVTLKRRCAVYTRKSTEEGLDQAFNSLDAQREACEAFILSQRTEGMVRVDDRYDDGGYSGGTLERPALKRLMADIAEGRVDVIVVYKIDRLSRSLMDFAKLVELFDAHGVTFVSVTQGFNTTTSMGRLTLNVLLSFAQFEREVTAERIRDKIAASRKKGMWMGGAVPLGYRAKERKLVIEKKEGALVRRIFEGFVEMGSTMKLARALRDEGALTRTGKPFDKGTLYKVLANPVYRGLAAHKGNLYPGEHEALIGEDVWQRVAAILKSDPHARARRTQSRNAPALLQGILVDAQGRAMSPSHTRKRGKLYRYYVSQRVLRDGADGTPLSRVPAAEIEAAVLRETRTLLRQPEIAIGTWAKARKSIPALAEREVHEALKAFDPLWEALFPAEQARILRLLLVKAQLAPEGLDLTFRVAGFETLAKELKAARGGGKAENGASTPLRSAA